MAIYSDLNQDTPQRNLLVEDVPDVKQSIRNIITTQKHERFFNPAFGAGLEDFIFELMDDRTAFQVESIIFSDVPRWDYRVMLDPSQTGIKADPDAYRYAVALVYQIRGLGTNYYDYNGYLNK